MCRVKCYRHIWVWFISIESASSNTGQYKNVSSTSDRVISQNVKCLITEHMVALYNTCFNMFSIYPWGICDQVHKYFSMYSI